MQKQQSCSYLLSFEEAENHLVKFLKKKSESQWVKYNFAHLADHEDLYKVFFRMVLEAARSENDTFWKFTWKKIELLNLQDHVLRESNYEIIKSTLINFEKHRLSIMRIAKKHLDDNEYTKMLETVFKYALYCHNNLLYGIVYNNVGCLNFLWDYVTDDEKTVILGCLGVLNVQKLFGILSVKYLLEDKVILQFLKHRSNLHMEHSNNFFLSDKKEGILLSFMNSPKVKEPQKKLDSLWKKTFESSTVEEQRKALLRLFLYNIKSPHNKITEWAWEKSLVLKQHIFLLKGANCYAIKHILVDCHSSSLHEFLCKARDHLARCELVEMLKEGVEHIVYWHGRVFDEAVENNSKSLQIALHEFGKSLSIQVLRSLKETISIKHNLILKYERLQETPRTWFAHYILTTKEAESEFVKFLKAIKDNEKITKESLDLEWNFRDLENLNSQNLYSALFRVFVFSVGLTNDVILFWILSKIKKDGVEKKVLKEQNYHFIKTVIDLSDVKIVNRALKFAMEYLDEDEIHCMYQEAYIHAVKWHGIFICGEVWDSTSSLETLKNLSRRNQWESIFKFTDQNFDYEAKRHFDGETENCCDTKRIRLV